jgi:hypothetical protein
MISPPDPLKSGKRKKTGQCSERTRCLVLCVTTHAGFARTIRTAPGEPMVGARVAEPVLPVQTAIHRTSHILRRCRKDTGRLSKTNPQRVRPLSPLPPIHLVTVERLSFRLSRDLPCQSRSSSQSCQVPHVTCVCPAGIRAILPACTKMQTQERRWREA